MAGGPRDATPSLVGEVIGEVSTLESSLCSLLNLVTVLVLTVLLHLFYLAFLSLSLFSCTSQRILQ